MPKYKVYQSREAEFEADDYEHACEVAEMLHDRDFDVLDNEVEPA